MAKKSKTEQTNGLAPEGADSAAASGAAVEPKKRAKRAKTSAKKPAAKKSSSRKAAAPKSSRARKSTAFEPSDEAIRIRAYFIAERRAQLSMQGDPAQDWLDARQQLIEEFEQD